MVFCGHCDRKFSFSDAPVLMGNFNSTILAQKMTKKAKNRTLKHYVAFHSHSFTSAEINYDTHDKELLAIFAAFKVWQHYLEGSLTLMDVVRDHKNLECFSTLKVLTPCQACWSEFLSQFNLIVHFCPGCLGTKPDSLTRHWDMYPKGGNNDYAKVNPINYRLVFTQEQDRKSVV